MFSHVNSNVTLLGYLLYLSFILFVNHSICHLFHLLFISYAIYFICYSFYLSFILFVIHSTCRVESYKTIAVLYNCRFLDSFHEYRLLILISALLSIFVSSFVKYSLSS